MTEQNFKYRTNPMFLRNQFYGASKHDMPIVPKFQVKRDDFEALRLIGFDRVKTEKDEHFDRMVHFFLYDYKFECFWEKPSCYIDNLRKYKAVLTPDFSMYIEMAKPLKIYNTFRNRWCGAYLASKGIRVVPTVNWGLAETFDFCFDGIEKGSTVAVSTYMVSEHGHHADQKDFFMAGYKEMLKRIEPEAIICYNTPFPQMDGNIIFVDYELSSWKHMDDDINKKFSPYIDYICGKSEWPKDCGIIRKIGYVVPDIIKGSGSAYGGKWIPKKADDERYLGKPGTINRTYFNGKNGGYSRETKIGEDGRATMERHFTDHLRPDKHSDPHDHLIEWDPNTGAPHPLSPINYPDRAPEFKNFKGGNIVCKDNNDEHNFETISEFKWSLDHGGEIVFTYNDKDYSITHPDGVISVCEGNKFKEAKNYTNSEDVLNHIIDGKKLREIIKEVTVWDRTI